MLSQLGSNFLSIVDDGSDITFISIHPIANCVLPTFQPPISRINQTFRATTMADSPGERPPSDAEGLDRPSENEDQLDDLHDEFDEPSRAEAADPADPDSDDESLLSEVDEAQFADFDPTAVQVAPDFDTLNKAIKVKKRKRADGEEEAPKKKKERTRERARTNRRRQDSDDGFSGGEQIEGKRRGTKSKPDGEKKQRPRVEIDEEALSPEERRRRALDRAMDAAVKKSSAKRIRKGDIVSSHAPVAGLPSNPCRILSKPPTKKSKRCATA